MALCVSCGWKIYLKNNFHEKYAHTKLTAFGLKKNQQTARDYKSQSTDPNIILFVKKHMGGIWPKPNGHK